MAPQYRSGHGSSSRVTPSFGDWGADADGPDCLNDQCQAVFWGHASRSMWNADLQSTITVSVSVQVVVGRARVCRSQVWEIVRRESRDSTGGGTRSCVKAEEAGPYAPE